MIVSCQSQSPSTPAVDSETTGYPLALNHKTSINTVEPQRQEPQLEAREMTELETFDRFPEDHDPRITALLSEPIPNDVIVSFYYIAASKNPRANYRWELHRDGQLFMVYHSGQNPSYEITFDQPLPTQPTKTLSDRQISDLYAQLDQVDFFNQPELQRDPRPRGGTYNVLRVRRNDLIHNVVYENVHGSLVQYLYSLTN